MALKTYITRGNIVLNFPLQVNGSMRRIEFMRYGNQFCTYSTSDAAVQSAIERSSGYGKTYELLSEVDFDNKPTEIIGDAVPAAGNVIPAAGNVMG